MTWYLGRRKQQCPHCTNYHWWDYYDEEPLEICPSCGKRYDDPIVTMKVVWKYTLTGYETLLHIPANSKILSATFQGDDIQVWALVNPDEKALEPHTILAVNTGDAFDINTRTLTFITTLIKSSGIVWHIFEKSVPVYYLRMGID